jgi:succinate-semialdehyde dehydrogenase/glutarate-semialdehyde dehydrogenase
LQAPDYPFKNFDLHENSAWISGQWVACDAACDVINPANQSVIGLVGMASESLMHDAIHQAYCAFDNWKKSSAFKRAEILRAIERKLIEEIEPLSTALCLEQGKTLEQAKAEIRYAASFFRWFSEEARRLNHRISSHPEDDRQFLVESNPVGVAALITPWNFPLAQGAKKIAAALAAGCAVVWKPSEFTPFVALAMGPIFKVCGCPDDVVQILATDGEVAGSVFGNSSQISLISVTGSTLTGQKVMASAANYLPKVSLELGGNAPFIILEDADLDHCVEDLIKLKLLCSGQVCVTANRVFIHKNIKAAFLKKLTARVAKVKLGAGWEIGIDAGPLIHKQACEKIKATLDNAISLGAKILYENKSYGVTSESGSFYPLTIVDHVSDEMELSCDEIFGPVISLLTYDRVEEVVERANATRYGLAAYVYGCDAQQTMSLAKQLEVGIIGINEWRPLKAEIPFGGVKMSGLGSEGGLEGLREFQESKVISYKIDS